MDFGDILGGGGFGEIDDDAQANQQDLFMFGMNTQEIEDMKR